MMGYSWNEWILYFAVYAVGGWVLEVLYARMRRGGFVNRGFLKGPLCPIYGFGAVGILALDQYLNHHVANGLQVAILLFALSALITSLLEYCVSWLLERVFHKKWWDYSDTPLNLHGRVCAGFSLLWGATALLLVGVIHPITEWLLLDWTATDYQLAVWGVAAYLVGDILYTVRSESMRSEGVLAERLLAKHSWAGGRSGRSIPAGVNDQDYLDCVADLLEHEEVKSMVRFVQHGDTTCLDHCLTVSYMSYRIARRLGLDDRSTARGGLLHDMFLYDWHVPDPDRKWHGFTHPRTALVNAERCFQLNPVERESILRHMWPLTPIPPRCPEAFIVSCCDKYVTVKEFMARMRYALRWS
jgi:uncharacterized protein